MANEEYLTVNHLPCIADHYIGVIVLINTDQTQCITTIIFTSKGYDFTASLNKVNKDMSLYRVTLKNKFNDSKGVSVDQFLQHPNYKLQANLTGDSIVLEVIRIALQSGDKIVYITQDIYSR
jgi:hypothetical protein